ncbi:MarR family winged helix-turn-helix transcriptional regulator [Ensifer aridi]|uniref:MarR family winged helix-turn-helix transcriptional regulator n=1 Tax=Ensifer aridi TaxID=1708715 RepID=UPI00196A0520|nr:MarR family winged helix-turn-helix transcriptional regulator [Ensifer aridi]
MASGPDHIDVPMMELVENFGFYAIEMVRLMRRCFDHDLAAAGLGMSPGEARALSFVCAFQNERQIKLAERMGVEPITFVGYIDSLAEKGLVERVRDREDRRANLISITPKAEPIIRKMALLNADIRQAATADFSEEEFLLLNSLLRRLRDRFSFMEATRRESAFSDTKPAAPVGRPPRRRRRA